MGNSSWHRSITPTIVSSRFSNWSYHDLGNTFNAFAVNDRVDIPVKMEAESADTTASVTVHLNAQQWSTGRKVVHLMVIYQAVFLCSLAITAIDPSSQSEDNANQPNEILRNIPYTAYLIGMSVGWLLAIPIVTLYYRRWPTVIVMTLFGLAQIGVGVSKGLILISVFRSIAGVLGAMVISVSTARMHDMASTTSITPYLISMLIAGLGTSFGPSYYFLLSSNIHPRWVSIFITFALWPSLLSMCFMSDTKHQDVDNADPGTSIWAKIGKHTHMATIEPICVFFTSPPLAILSINAGLSTAVSFAMYRSLPTILATGFTLSQLEQSLCFFSLMTGYCVAFLALLIYNKTRARTKLGHKEENDDTSFDNELEQQQAITDAQRRSVNRSKHRWFWPIMPLVVLSPLSLAFFAFTSQPQYSLFVPLAFLAITSACAFVSFACGWLYVHEQDDDSDKAPARAMYMSVVLALSVGLCVIINKLLEAVPQKSLFGIFAGVTAFSTLAVMVLWICSRKAKAPAICQESPVVF